MNLDDKNEIARTSSDLPPENSQKKALAVQDIYGTVSQLSAVVAISQDGVIGRNGDLPWRLSGDLKRFKSLTMGGVLIMGRKTYDSIGRPLPGRTTVVLTRDTEWSRDGVHTANDEREAIKIAANRPTFVVGGAEIYRQMLPRCERVLLTRVLADVEGDTFLDLDLTDFEVRDCQKHPSTERDEYATEFIEYHRKKRS